MEENTLDLLGLQLVDYFINFQNYQPFNVTEKFREHAKGKVYLVNKENNKYQIIKLIKQEIFNASEAKVAHDHVIEHIKDELKLSGDNFKILVLVLNNDGHNENQQSPTVDIIIATPAMMVKELNKIYPTINKIITTEFVDEEQSFAQNEDGEEVEVSAREQKWKKVNFQNRRFLKDALLKSTNPHLTVTWLFFALPIFAYFIFTIISSSSNILSSVQSINIINLFFGASTRNLVYGANQYWRWLTYPFVQFNSITLLFSIWMFYRVGRYIEGFYGLWKAVIIWVGGIILVGMIQTTVDQVDILNGFTIVVLITLGAMIPIIWNYKLFKTPIMAKFGFSFIWFFLFWTFFDGQVVTLLYWMIALAAGWLMGAVVSYHNRKLTLFYAFSPVAIGLLVLFTILVYFLNPYYNYDNQNYTIGTLELYKQFNLCSDSFINWVSQHYFGKY